jgi:hypothetical protein
MTAIMNQAKIRVLRDRLSVTSRNTAPGVIWSGFTDRAKDGSVSSSMSETGTVLPSALA